MHDLGVGVGTPARGEVRRAGLPLPADLEGVVLHEGPPDYSYGAGALCCAVLCCLRAGVKAHTCTGVCSFGVGVGVGGHGGAGCSRGRGRA